ncbi:MAG: hypothetical protein CL920_32080 [Deltaproteobacteria bacterium]|nr:hypothetical protein [Deltaproteobacteria bacterium]MBU53360.1 hypothetical protein [Deltaproteobacteria bacterium]
MRAVTTCVLKTMMVLSLIVGVPTTVWATPSHKRTQRPKAFHPKKANKKTVAKKDGLPDIAPIAPLPSVYREIHIDTAPSGLAIEIYKKNKRLACLPANKTPCKVRVVGFQAIPLRVVVYKGSQIFKMTRKLKGRNMSVERWFLPIASSPTRQTVTTTPIERRPPPPKTDNTNVLIALGVVAAVGAATAGIVIGTVIYNQNKVSFGCASCGIQVNELTHRATTGKH